MTKAIKTSFMAVMIATLLTMAGCSNSLKPSISSTELERDTKAKFDELYNAPLPTQPLTEGMAVALTLRQNLDIKVKEMELFIERTKGVNTFLQHAPSLTYNHDWRERDKLPLSTSERINADGTIEEIDEVDTNPSYSSELDQETTNLTFKVDLLNLWQWYYDNNIHKANVEIRNRNRIKAAQNVTIDAVQNFKFAQISQTLSTEFSTLRDEMEQLKSSSCSVIGSSSQVKAKLLKQCKIVVSNSRQLSKLQKQLNEAKINFNATITAHPSAEVRLVPIDMSAMPKVTKSLDELIDIALQNPTELEIERFKYIIAKNNQYKAWTDIFPSLEIGTTYKTDENKFLVNDNWKEDFVTLNWNFIQKAVSAPYRAKTAKYEALAADDVRSKAAIVTLATKVALSVDAYNQAVDQWESSNRLALISRDEFIKAEGEHQSGRISGFEQSNARKEMLVTQLQSMVDYADLWGSAARLYGSLGIRIIPQDKDYRDYSLVQLAKAFDAKFTALGISG